MAGLDAGLGGFCHFQILVLPRGTARHGGILCLFSGPAVPGTEQAQLVSGARDARAGG